jgi:hypothetical protein
MQIVKMKNTDQQLYCWAALNLTGTVQNPFENQSSQWIWEKITNCYIFFCTYKPSVWIQIGFALKPNQFVTTVGAQQRWRNAPWLGAGEPRGWARVVLRLWSAAIHAIQRWKARARRKRSGLDSGRLNSRMNENETGSKEKERTQAKC